MSADYTPALWIPTQHFGGWPFAPRYIIIHGTAGGSSAQGIAQYFQSNNPPSSTHYVVGVDGTVVQCVSESEPAWGNGVLSAGHDAWWSGNPNSCTFSIEHCKPHTDNSDTLTPEQRAASFALVQHLCEKHNIPRRWADGTGGITGHYSIDPVNRKYCPGPYPWAALFAFLNDTGGTTMAWHRQTDGTGRDDKGHSCGVGFMSEIAAKGITADGMRSETYLSGLAPVASFMTLESGDVMTWDGHTVGFDGAHVVEGLLRVNEAQNATLQTMQHTIADLNAKLASAQQVAPADPLAAEALDVLRRQKAFEAKL